MVTPNTCLFGAQPTKLVLLTSVGLLFDIVTTSTGWVLETAPNLHWVSHELLSKNQIPGSDIYIYIL